MKETCQILLIIAAAGLVMFAVFWGLDRVAGSAYNAFTADCAQSTIQTQYMEQHGKRAMIVQCERAK